MDAHFWDGKRAPGVPDQIDLTQYQNLVEIFENSVTKFADKPAYTGIGHTISYGELDRLSAQFASYLQSETSLKPGDRIAIQMPNLLQYPISLFGALRAGLIVVNTNPLYTEREMLHQFNDAGVKALVFVDLFADKVEKILPQTRIEHLIMTSIGDSLPTFKRWLVNGAARYVKKVIPAFSLPSSVGFNAALGLGSGREFSAPEPAMQDDVAVLQYTGGTTGVAKGAMLTHGNLIANMLQVKANFEQCDDQGKKFHDPGCEHLVAPLPLYHIYSFTVHMMVAMSNGDHNILIANPRDIDQFIKAIKPWPITGFVGLNTLFVALMNHPDFKHLDFSRLKTTSAGGTALVADTASRWQAITGTLISEGYGLTECSPVVTANFGYGLAKIGTVGVPVVQTSLKVVDAEGDELGIGDAGELCVKGPQVMKGYWQRDSATSDVMDAAGWFRTGDVAVIREDGFVSIVDRIKDMVLVSGFNVYPNEIEEVVCSHPAIDSCAVIGVNDDTTGEAVKLFVVSSDAELTADDVISFCRDQLTAYKVPKQVEFRSELPMSPVGKILRKELRSETERSA